MWPFSSRRERRKDIFEMAELLLVKRLESEAQVESARADSQVKLLERDLKIANQRMEHADKLSEERRERARLQRQNRAVNGDGKRWFGNMPRQGQQQIEECPVCRDPSSIHLTADQIIWHRAQRHPDRIIVPGHNGYAN